MSEEKVESQNQISQQEQLDFLNDSETLNDPEISQFQISKKKKTKDLKKSKCDAVIEICNPVTKKETFGKYTVYTVKGVDQNGPFETIRRYSDFEKIRATLQIQWPGVYIAPLPPKKTVKNLESEFVEDRLKGLNFFCQNVSKIQFLHYSDEFQLFIRSSSTDVDKLLHAFQKIKNTDLMERYSKEFAYLGEKELNSKTVPKIFVFRMMYLTKLKDKLQSLKKHAKKMMKAKQEYYSKLYVLQENVCVPFEDTVLAAYHDRNQSKNVFTPQKGTSFDDKVQTLAGGGSRKSFENTYEFIRSKCREVNALMEAIDQRDKYNSMKNKANDKKKSEINDLQRVQSGKVTFNTLILKKPVSGEISKITSNITTATKEADDLTALHDMIILILAYRTIPKFIKANLGAFKKLMLNVRDSELESLTNIEGYWEALLENENLKSISLEK